ncbi:uncharacterized protein METZ01_LOCUS194292, partial [marine metagenome]
MLTEDVTMTDIRATRLLAFLVAMAVMAASCGSDPEAKVASSSPPTDLAVAEPDDSEDSSGIELDDPHNLRFHPAKWEEIPDWWLDVQDVPMERLVLQQTRWVETTPSDRRASEMHLGERVLKWSIPADWVENCVAVNACTYGPDEESPGTKGFVVGWGGAKPRTWASDPATNGRRLKWSELRTYVAGETQPLDCEANKDQGDPEADDLYPEPWFVACVGTIDEFTIARVEMFRLDEDCEPYGNSYGAWIGWENAHRSNIDVFVESLADQMLADRIECVTPETLFALDYGGWDVSSSRSTFAGEISRIWVAELQRRIGAEPDGIYGLQTLELHFEAVKDIAPLPVVPMISSGPCGIFKFVLSNWPFEGLISRWSAGSGWMPTLNWRNASLNLYDPPAVVGGWWRGSEEELVPPPPDWVQTADVTGDGVNDFILRWSGAIQSTTAVATVHKTGSNCSWRYVGGSLHGPLYYRLYPSDHDYWHVEYKSYGDSQGNHCVLNDSYAWYDPVWDRFQPTICQIYSELEEQPWTAWNAPEPLADQDATKDRLSQSWELPTDVSQGPCGVFRL